MAEEERKLHRRRPGEVSAGRRIDIEACWSGSVG